MLQYLAAITRNFHAQTSGIPIGQSAGKEAGSGVELTPRVMKIGQSWAQRRWRRLANSD